MDDKTNAEAVPEQRTVAEPTQAARPVSTEVTTALDPSTNVQDTCAVQASASEPPSDKAEQSAPLPDKSLSFLQPGTQPGSLGRLGHYEVLELLGQGGFGIVLKALDDKLQRMVAIKVLGPQLVWNATARSRFVREARAAAKVNSKYVVSTYEVHEQPIPHLVMEYVAGKTLHERIEQTGPLASREIYRIGAEIAEGLAAAHQQGLIHRDIKPANILLEAGRVKIADFGLARAVDDASLTRTGAIAGTPMFMSPEQARGETLDHRSDLFSLGSVLYTLCTGQAPFRAQKTLAVLKRVCDDTPQPIRECNAAIPVALAAIVNRLLVKDAAGRFQTAAAVADQLRQHLDHDDDSVLADAETIDHLPAVSARSNAVPPGKRAQSRWKWAAAGALVLLPVLALALTEAAGFTHLFRGGSTRTDPNKPMSSEPSPPLVVAPVDTRTEKKRSTEPEKPIPKDPPAIPVAEENLFQKAKVDDWADYKMTQVRNGTKMEEGKLRIEVTAKTETTAKIRLTITVGVGSYPSPEQDVDLTKPFDALILFLGSNAKVEKSGQWHFETIKRLAKEYETSWVKMKPTMKVEGVDGGNLESTLKFWTSQNAPLGGLVKMETTSVQKTPGNRIESTTKLEFTRSGSKAALREARSSAARGEWNAAVTDYARYFAEQPLEDGEVGFEYATVLLLSGDQAGYRKICAAMLERSGQLSVRHYHVARAWTLAPDSVKETALAGEKANNELKRSQSEFWSLTEQGALAYRAGRYDEAVPLLEQSLKADSKSGRAVLNWLWLALVEDRRGKPTEASAWLEKATKWLDQYPEGYLVVLDDKNGLHLHNWIEAQVLRREAERALALTKKTPK